MHPEGKTLIEMTGEVRRCNIEKGWRPADGGPGDNTFGDYAALLVEEIGEMVSAYRKRRLADATARPDYENGDDDPEDGPTSRDHLPKPEGVGAELADILIRLIGMADAFGFDLGAEYERKMAHNWTRPYQHGGTMADVPDVTERRKTP